MYIKTMSESQAISDRLTQIQTQRLITIIGVNGVFPNFHRTQLNAFKQKHFDSKY